MESILPQNDANPAGSASDWCISEDYREGSAGPSDGSVGPSNGSAGPSDGLVGLSDRLSDSRRFMVL